MNEGFWINYVNGKTVRIYDHEIDIRNPATFKKLGFNVKEMKDFTQFEQRKDREKFLLWLMKKYPLMRVRGHGTSVTFDFNSSNRSAPIDAIFEFGEENLGPFSHLSINNYATKENTSIGFQAFKDLLDSDGVEGVLRYGSKERVNTDILKELRRISTEIDMTNIFQK